MKNFEEVKFNGVFRTYQKKVLDKIITHIEDGKVHIVAAPGSGKTILGLELIRYLNEPALVFSPSITIRQQWGERFKENFLQNKDEFDDYFSYSFNNMKLITSVTYQSLYAAYNKLKDNSKDEDEDEMDNQDYSSFDIFEEIKKNNIKTICLDEAHHLRSEWQRALEEFIHSLGDEIKIVSLTATPPYDSTPGEWKKYSSLCGEIDEEIFIPELVGQKNLCPHQDFIYFTYPSEKENKLLKNHREKVLKCIDYICNQEYFGKIIRNIHKWYKNDEYSVLENFKEMSCILALGKFYGYQIDEELIKLVCPTDTLPSIDFEIAQTAFQFICDSVSFFFEISQIVFKEIKTRGLIERKKVDFAHPEKLSNSLASSISKLNGISKIIEREYLNLQDDLRMVILTDYIKKDLINDIGTNEPLKTLGTASIFEHIRRMNITNKIAILSGSLIIVNKDIAPLIEEEASLNSIKILVKPLKETTEYVEIVFSGKNKEKVNIITKIFEAGHINIIVGTKSLLGEGWDSPCINSLILASFVKSFMLSNQMRGRAIRIDKKNSCKCSNIFHLATIEDDYKFEDERINKLNLEIFNTNEKIISSDFEVVKKRFDCFLAPAYFHDVIEDGIERIENIVPPFNKENIEKINESTLEICSNRDKTIKRWENTTSDVEHMKIVEECDVTSTVRPKKILVYNIISLAALLALTTSIVPIFILLGWLTEFDVITLFSLIMVINSLFIVRSSSIIFRFHTPYSTTKTMAIILLKALKKANIIKTKEAKVVVNKNENNIISCGIMNGTIYEKDVFTKALVELLSQINNPRYLLVKKYGKILTFTTSYACPSILAVNRENAKILAKCLESVGGKYELIYTRIPGGRMNILKARKYSFINKNGEKMRRIKRVEHVDDKYLKFDFTQNIF